ncbi:hypothetical protein QU38_02110, partial [Staphylococcus aureus]
GLDDAQVQRGDAIDAHVAGHLLVLEGLARVLTATGRTDRTVRDRHTVRGAQTAEIPALHTAGEALTDRGAGDVDELADDEVIGLDLGADREQRVLGHAELGDLALRLDLGGGELAALRLRQVHGLACAGAELQRHVAVLVLGAVAEHLTVAQLQHSHG